MRIDYTRLNAEDFSVKLRELPVVGEVALINPTMTKHKWVEDELHLRSVLVRVKNGGTTFDESDPEDGQVLSMGFPKFFNLDEYPPHTKLTLDLLDTNGHEVEFLPKLDGTLIIRSVIRTVHRDHNFPGSPGMTTLQVHFRSRGCHDLGEFEGPILALIRERYPFLLDCTFEPEGPGTSMLFEYVGPTNQIVVRYDEPELVALMTVDHKGPHHHLRAPHPSTVAEMKHAEVTMSLLTDIPIRDHVIGHLSPLTGMEGFVSRVPCEKFGFTLLKWKTPWYIRLHGLRSNATPRYMREYCVRYACYFMDSLKDQLARDGLDWETISFIEPAAIEALDLIVNAARRVVSVTARILEQMDVMKADGCEPARKDVALMCKSVTETLGCSGLFSYALMVALNKKEKANDLEAAYLLGISGAEFKSMKARWAKEDGGI